MLKRTVIILYLAIIVVMMMASMIGKSHGSEYAVTHIYTSWWMTVMWAMLTATAITWIIRRKMRHASLIALHSALAVILAGALLTHLLSKNGIIYLRQGEATDTFMIQGSNATAIGKLPFTVMLNSFHVTYHEGTASPADYISALTITDGNKAYEAVVSMNKIFSTQGVRLCQSGFDDDGQGSYLTVNIDPWGIAVTYLGYALLFISLLWMLADPKGSFRQLLHHPLLQKGVLMLLTAMTATMTSQATNTLTREQADRFGQLFIDYNGRICQVQTYALDFCKKLYGKRHYGDYSAEQVLAGFVFYGDNWCEEPFIKVKSGAIRQKLALPGEVSFNDFFREQNYILGPLLMEYAKGSNDKLHRDATELDDKLQIILNLRRGLSLKLFPYSQTDDSSITWYAPSSKLPEDMEAQRKKYIKEIFGIINNDMRMGNDNRVEDALIKIQKYQRTFGASTLPSPTSTAAERIYNAFPFATILFMVNLATAFLSLFFRRISWCILLLSAMALTVCIILRWIIGGTVPLSNGYETMLIIAWMVEWMALAVSHRIPVMVTFGLFISGFALLVSHIGQMNPAITHIMPVLNSPLLSIHVAIIMLAYAMLCITFVCGVTALLRPSRAEYLQVLSQLFLYPAIAALGIGIFTGAIWANVSWGTYWSWDPKEVWALITFMAYAGAVHSQSVPLLRKANVYHIYMVAAFITLLMTYFGVNYFLGGMHSYA